MRFRNQLVVGHTVVLLVTILIGATAVIAFRVSTGRLERVLGDVGENVVDVGRLQFEAEQVVATSRGYLLTGDAEMLQHFQDAAARVHATIARLGVDSDHPADLARVGAAAQRYVDAAEQAAGRRTTSDSPRELLPFFERKLTPARKSFETALSQFVDSHRTQFGREARGARQFANVAEALVGGTTAIALILGITLASLSIRRLNARYTSERDATEVARRAVASRDELLAVVSHDLRGPLQTITMGVAVMEDAIPEASRRHLTAIENAAERMNYLIEQLVDLAKLDHGTFEIEVRSHSVTEIIDSLFSIYETRARARGVELANRVGPELPALRADRDRVLQVLSNLVGNALKFTPSGGTIEIRARQQGAGMRFEVADSGPGVAPDEVDKIFERYWKGATSRGVGLGLYICKRIVLAHGGSIGLDVGQGGTTFWFVLPSAAARLRG